MDTIKIDSKFADKNGEIMVVELEGYIDQSNYHKLQKIFEDIIKSGCYKIIVDFDKLDYISSAGWGVFVGEVKRFRDNNGDIKLVRMHDDVYDVFHLLEFYHILDDYSSIQEAAAQFDTQSVFIDLVDDSKPVINTNEQSDPIEAEIDEVDISLETLDNEDTHFVDKTIPPSKSVTIEETAVPKDALKIQSIQKKKIADLPINEKIKRIIAQNPLLTVRGIKKVLRHEQFGNVKMGYFRLRKILKEMDLNTKDKRYRYYRSC